MENAKESTELGPAEPRDGGYDVVNEQAEVKQNDSGQGRQQDREGKDKEAKEAADVEEAQASHRQEQRLQHAHAEAADKKLDHESLKAGEQDQNVDIKEALVDDADSAAGKKDIQSQKQDAEPNDSSDERSMNGKTEAAKASASSPSRKFQPTVFSRGRNLQVELVERKPWDSGYPATLYTDVKMVGLLIHRSLLVSHSF